jgi:hypothetical protein
MVGDFMVIVLLLCSILYNDFVLQLLLQVVVVHAEYLVYPAAVGQHR